MQACFPLFLRVMLSICSLTTFLFAPESPQIICSFVRPTKYSTIALQTQRANLKFPVMLMLFTHAFGAICVCKVQRPLQLCLSSGAVGGLLTCRHGAFLCQCLPVPCHVKSLADPVTPTTLLRKHCLLNV